MQPVASPLTMTWARAELLIPAREVRGQCRHGRVPSATVLEHGDIGPQQKQLAAPGGAMPPERHPGLAALNRGSHISAYARGKDTRTSRMTMGSMPYTMASDLSRRS